MKQPQTPVTAIVFDGRHSAPTIESLEEVEAKLRRAVATGWGPFEVVDEYGEPFLVMPHRVTHVRAWGTVLARRRSP